ncbi:hypothetical protein Y11_p0651 (plasmid) [Yersinia enterocolitica subsp. palearctica Y11]|uniref:Uncharacterized protein n=1 Tax=Yersinia enterocolitica subsp. palearctica serotype O:3 (strain DSM 13030 / CIP 106945 / Y11) TaxID=930944 RepID=A0A0H3NY57_YERE1|nr:hypothetical protein Y11_p0651 [Yersinia enterocolitica subsp. palearctica Y11]
MECHGSQENFAVTSGHDYPGYNQLITKVHPLWAMLKRHPCRQQLPASAVLLAQQVVHPGYTRATIRALASPKKSKATIKKELQAQPQVVNEVTCRLALFSAWEPVTSLAKVALRRQMSTVKTLLPDKCPREEESPTAREALLVVEVLQNQLGEYLLHRPSALNARVLFRCQKEQYLIATGLSQKHSAHEEAQLQHHGASLDKNDRPNSQYATLRC